MAPISKIPSMAIQKRISKSGEVTEADVEQYIKQVGQETIQAMNLTPENIKEYLKNIVELGQSQSKKKLPSKKKMIAGDSVLVVDNSGKVSKVESTPDKRGEDFESKSLSRKTVEGTLNLGSKAFNKMFPTVGKIMGWVQNKIDRQTRAAVETNTSIQGYSHEAQKSSKLLDTIIESQIRTNGILQQILAVVAAKGSPSPTSSANPAPSQEPPANRVGGSDLTRNVAAGAAAATVAAAGAGAVLASRGSAELPTPTQAAAPPAASGAVAAATPVAQPTPATTSPQAGPPGTTETRSSTQSSFSLQVFRTADPDGAREFETVVRTRTREIEQQLNARIPANLDRNAVEMHREANKSRAESTANAEARQQFAERIQRTQPQAAARTTTAGSTTPTAAATAASRPTAVSAVSAATATPVSTESLPTTDTASRLLNIKAKEIIFKADKFEYPQSAISVAGGGVSGGGISSTASSPPASVSGGGTAAPPSSGAAGAQAGLPELTSIRTKSGKSVQVAASVAGKFQGFLNDLEATGYGIREIGGYANRPNVNNPSVMSTHASGLAIDINPAQNPNRSTTTDMPPETGQIAAKWGLGWGMNWRSVKDPMHFSAAANEGAGSPQPAVATAVAAGGISSDGAPSGGGGRGAPPAMPAASAAPSAPSSGAAVARASTADEVSSRATPSTPSIGQNAPAPIAGSQSTPGTGAIDPNNPGEVEPPDADVRYARLFNMAA